MAARSSNFQLPNGNVFITKNNFYIHNSMENGDDDGEIEKSK